MSEKILNTRIQQKSDTFTNWTTAGNNNFIPKKGEIIHFSDLDLIKIGDGINTVNDLKYVGADYIDSEISSHKGSFSHIKNYTSNVSGVAGTSTTKVSTTYDVTDTSVTSYEHGMIVALKFPVAGVSTYGTLFQINSLGYKPVVRNVSSAISTIYAAGSIVLLIYDATQTATAYLTSNVATTITGCWKVADYDANTTAISNLVRAGGTKIVDANLYRYVLCLQTSETNIVPISSTVGTSPNSSTATSKTITSTPFDPFGDIYYYNTSAIVTSGSTVKSSTLNLSISSVDLRYTFNTAKTLTANKIVYMVATPQNNGKAVLTSPYITQTLPSSDDSKIYITLGYAASTYTIELYANHPIYKYENNGIGLYTGQGAANDWVATNGTNVLSHLANTSNPHNVTASQIGLGNVRNTRIYFNEQSEVPEEEDLQYIVDYDTGIKYNIDTVYAQKSELVTKTSDLTNDSGFLTLDTLPRYSGATS